jgi:hypothetical protein
MKLIINGLMTAASGVAFVGVLTHFLRSSNREGKARISRLATDFAKVRRKAMTRDAKRGSITAFATFVIEFIVNHGRRGAHFLFEVLKGAYDTHMERAEMRLAPVKPRSWREIQMGMRQSGVRVDDFKQRLDQVDDRAAELVPLQMSMWQSDVRFDDFKQGLDHVDDCAAEPVPRCCGENTLWFWQRDTTLPDIVPVIVDGRRAASMRSVKSPRVYSRLSSIVACPVSPREHVGDGLCVPSVMC